MSGSQLSCNNVAPLNQSQGRSNLAQRVSPKQQNWRQHRRPAVQSAACSTQVTEGEAVVGSGRAATGQAQVSVTAKPLHSAPPPPVYNLKLGQKPRATQSEHFSPAAFLKPEGRQQGPGPTDTHGPPTTTGFVTVTGRSGSIFRPRLSHQGLAWHLCGTATV